MKLKHLSKLLQKLQLCNLIFKTVHNAVFKFEKSQITMIDCKNPKEIFGETRQSYAFRQRAPVCDVLLVKRTCGTDSTLHLFLK